MTYLLNKSPGDVVRVAVCVAFVSTLVRLDGGVGKVTKDELKSVMSSLGKELTDEEL